MYPGRKREDTCLKIVVAPPWKSDLHGEPALHMVGRDKETRKRTKPRTTEPDDKRPANGTRRHDQPPEAPARPTHQGTGAHTPKANKPGSQETFCAFNEQHTVGTSAPRFDLMGETLAVLPPPRVSPQSLVSATMRTRQERAPQRLRNMSIHAPNRPPETRYHKQKLDRLCSIPGTIRALG